MEIEDSRPFAMNRERCSFELCWLAVRPVCSICVSLCWAIACASPPLLLPKSPEPPPTPYPVAEARPTTTAGSPPGLPASGGLAGALGPAASHELSSFGSAAIADSGPLILERASPDGRWLGVCQARQDSNGDGRLSASVGPRGELRGDAMARYLIAPGEELSIEALLGADASGRFVLVMQRGALLLWDSQSRSSLDLSALGADARLSAESFAELRTLAFDAAGEQLLYLKSGDSGARIVVRSLSDGSERAFDPGPGPIWRAHFDPGGAYLVAGVLSDDSNKNGKADFPAPLLAAPRPCSAGPGRFHSWSERGDRPETVLVPLNGAAVIHEPELVMPIRDALLLRDATGALLLERDGKKRLLEPADCKGRVVHADAARELFIIGCAQKKKTGRVSLELVTPDGRKPLGIELASSELDRDLSDSPRLLALYPGADSALFDADKRQLIPLESGDIVVTTRKSRALVRRGNALLIYDADSHTEQPQAGVVDSFPQILVSGPFALVSPLLVNLDTATLVGQSKRRALALSNTGQLLVSDDDPDSSGLTHGPLRWTEANP